MRLTTMGMAFAAVLAIAGCYTMKQVTIDDLSVQRAPRVWVTRADRSVVLVNDAQMFRGKLVGFVEGKYRELQPAELQVQPLLRRDRFVAELRGHHHVGKGFD